MDFFLTFLAVIKLAIQTPVEWDTSHLSHLEVTFRVINIVILLAFWCVCVLVLRGIMGQRKRWATTWDTLSIRSNAMCAAFPTSLHLLILVAHRVLGGGRSSEPLWVLGFAVALSVETVARTAVVISGGIHESGMARSVEAIVTNPKSNPNPGMIVTNPNSNPNPGTIGGGDCDGAVIYRTTIASDCAHRGALFRDNVHPQLSLGALRLLFPSTTAACDGLVRSDHVSFILSDVPGCFLDAAALFPLQRTVHLL